MISILPIASLNAQNLVKAGFKRIQDAINVMLLARHVMILKTIIALNVEVDIFNTKPLK